MPRRAHHQARHGVQLPTSVWGGASGHTYTFTRQPGGLTDVDAVVIREGTNLKSPIARDRAGDRRQARPGQAQGASPLAHA